MGKQYGRLFYEADGANAGAGTPPPAANAGGNGSGDAGAGAGAGTPPPAAATPPPATADWISGIKNDEIRGFVQTKGFKDPEILADSYRQLEKLIGVPKDQILKLPTDFNTPEGEAVFQRLGKPEKPEGYNIEVPKDATPADKEFMDWAKNTFHKSNMTSDQAKNLLGEWNSFQQAAAKKQLEAIETQNKTEYDTLKSQWGNAYDQKLEVGKAAAKEFGLTQEQIQGIQNTVGYEKTMKLFHDIGSKLGETPFVQGNGKNGFGAMDTETAKSLIAAKKSDSEFMKKYSNGDANAKAEMGRLYKDAYPGEITIG